MDEDELELALYQFSNYLFDLRSAFRSYNHYCGELGEYLKKPELYSDEVINESSLQVALNKFRINKAIEDCRTLTDILDAARDKKCMDAISAFNKLELAFFKKTPSEWNDTLSFLTRKQKDETLMMRQIRVPVEYNRQEIESALKAKEAAISI